MANEGERPDSGWVIVQMMTASGSCASPGLENALFHGGSNGREEAGLKTCLEVPIATILARTSTGKSVDKSVTSRDDISRDDANASPDQPYNFQTKQPSKEGRWVKVPSPSVELESSKQTLSEEALARGHPTANGIEEQQYRSGITAPQGMDELFSYSSLARRFPHFSSDQIEEWIQKCKTSRDSEYFGEEVKLSIVREYNLLEDEIECPETTIQDAPTMARDIDRLAAQKLPGSGICE